MIRVYVHNREKYVYTFCVIVYRDHFHLMATRLRYGENYNLMPTPFLSNNMYFRISPKNIRNIYLFLCVFLNNIF